MHLNRTDIVVIIVGSFFLAGGALYLATYQPFVKEAFPMRYEFLSVENTTTGDPADGLPDLTICVQNWGGKTGEESVQFDTKNCLYIDGVPVTGYTIDPPDGLLEARGEIATITIPCGGKGFGEKVRVLVLSVDGWGYERSFFPDRLWYDYYPNGEVK